MRRNIPVLIVMVLTFMTAGPVLGQEVSSFNLRD